MDSIRRLAHRTLVTAGVVAVALSLHAPNVAAHPGRTASDGCHYCRTRCDYWGEAWNQRHCHGGGGGGGGGSSTSGGSAPPPDTTPPSDPRVTAAGVDGSTVTLTVVGESGSTIRVLAGGTVVASVRATGELQTVSFRLPDGQHRLEVLARDAAGNESEAVVRTVTVDATAPEPAAVTAEAPDAPAHPWVGVSLRGEPGATWEALAAPASDGERAPVRENGRLPASGEATVDLLLPNGIHTVTVTLEDQAGNVSTAATAEVSVDLPPPGAPQLTVVSDEGATPIEIEVIGPPLGTIKIVSGDGAADPVEVSLDEEGKAVTEVDLPDGSHTLVGTASDFQGQTSPEAIEVGAVVDTTEPELSVRLDDEALSEGRLVWTVETEAGATVAVHGASADVDEQLEMSDGSASGEATPDAGEHTLTVTATDAYGNEVEEVLTFTVADTTSILETLLGFGLLGGLGYGGYRLFSRRRRGAGEPEPVTEMGPVSGSGSEGLDVAAEDEGDWSE